MTQHTAAVILAAMSRAGLFILLTLIVASPQPTASPATSCASEDQTILHLNQRLTALTAAIQKLGYTPASIQSLINNTNTNNGHIDFIVVPQPRIVGQIPEGWQVFADGSSAPALFTPR